MEKETSAGAVVYKILNNKLYILIEKMGLGHLSIPKGHLEKDETLVDAAIREIKEETSLDVILDTNFKEKITYKPHINKDVLKDVYFFVAKIIDVNQTPIDLHDDEVVDFYFLEENEAINILTYPNDKEIVTKAIKYIKQKENIL